MPDCVQPHSGETSAHETSGLETLGPTTNTAQATQMAYKHNNHQMHQLEPEDANKVQNGALHSFGVMGI